MPDQNNDLNHTYDAFQYAMNSAIESQHQLAAAQANALAPHGALGRPGAVLGVDGSWSDKYEQRVSAIRDQRNSIAQDRQRIEQLLKLAADPTESALRRERARKIVMDITGGTFPPSPVALPTSGTIRPAGAVPDGLPTEVRRWSDTVHDLLHNDPLISRLWASVSLMGTELEAKWDTQTLTPRPGPLLTVSIALSRHPISMRLAVDMSVLTGPAVREALGRMMQSVLTTVVPLKDQDVELS
jgi:hypothetical protein